MTKRQSGSLVHSPDEIPDFASDKEEQEFWNTHEHADDFFDNALPAPDEMLPAVLREARSAQAGRREGSA
jgi:hypothetical protein